jgi:hypothetical protein
MLLVHYADHLSPLDIERGTGGNRRGCGQTPPRHCRQGTLSHKLARGEKRDDGFLASLRNDRDLGATLLKIEDGIGRISLRKEVLFSSPW